jgi:Protein of unknown function (DUF3710)
MAFGRGKKDRANGAALDDAEAADESSDDSSADAGLLGDLVAATAAADRRPLDDAEAGGDDALPRLDLGGLRIPILQGTEVRVEMNDAQQPIAATIMHNASSLQILAFAAPRHSGIWAEVRAEIAESVRTGGGHVDEVDAGFGPELKARVRTEAQPGQVTEQALRFVGFDGPRWFVRGVFSGPAATDSTKASVLETVLTSVVVVRGTDPMAPRDPLPLRLPREVIAGAEAAADEDAADGADGEARPKLELPERGPEITETR